MQSGTTATYSLSLHDALPILLGEVAGAQLRLQGRLLDLLRVARAVHGQGVTQLVGSEPETEDRKSTRLNSSHVESSYAVFCLKKKTPRMAARRESGWQVRLVP